MRRWPASPLIACLLAAGGPAALAHADDAAERRALAPEEEEFLVGRYDQVGRLAGVRDGWWRRAARAPEPAAAGSQALPDLGDGEPPLAIPPPAEPGGWATLVALLRDRVRRETRGSDGLPGESPLAALLAALLPPVDPSRPHPGPTTADDLIAHALSLQAYVYRRGPAEQDPDPAVSGPARAAAQEAQGLRRGAFVLGLLILAGLLVLTLVAGWIAGLEPAHKPLRNAP